MNIEVNVTGVDLATVTGGYGPDGEPTTLGDLVVAEIARQYMRTDDLSDLHRQIRMVRDEVIRERVTPMIEEAVSRPIQRTGSYGDPIGEPVSMREVVVDEARKVLQGTPNGSYGRDREPIGRKLIREMVEKELRDELADAIKDERQKVVDAVRGQAAELITEAVTKGVTGR
ncbi:MAG: hypothetical protein ACRDP6_44825 [Actinoallomurus sp.]